MSAAAMIEAAFGAVDCFRAGELGPAPFWRGHLPFAGFIVALQRPNAILELGVQNGDSLFAFANAMATYGPPGGRVIGVDAWAGDPHVGEQADWIYNRVAALAARFGEALTLKRAYFADAVDTIEDGSIDLLHLDGTHTYAQASADLSLYRRKLSPRAIVLMHDIAVFRQDFGVWRLWLEEKAKAPHFSFAHSCGLGVLGAGAQLDDRVAAFIRAGAEERAACRTLFSRLGKLALLEHTPPADLARVLPIGSIPPAADAAQDPEFASALAIGRW